MEDDKMTESNLNETNQEVKTESPENAVTSPDIVPLQKPSNNGNGTEKNGQKRIKTDPGDGSSKKPRINTPEVPTIIPNKAASDDIDNMSDVEEYYLTVSNLPKDWTYVQIKNYLDKECGHVDEMEMLQQKDSQTCAILLTFQSSEKRKDVFKKLEDKVIQEKKLKLEMTESYTPPSLNVSATESTDIEISRPWRPDQDVCETDPQGLYGLRPQFLKSLDINPPITRLVNVTNFRCDKSELKDVMELAGNVLMCSIVPTHQRFAKVMYSHPLEAVQAISMLNGQMYYGNPLKITMDNASSDTIILPKGLASVGLGLGLQGRPIRNIAHQYQRYAKKQSSLINPIVFSRINFSDNDKSNVVNPDEDPEEIQRKINDFVKSTTGHLQNEKLTFTVKTIDELVGNATNSKEGSDRSTPEPNITKASQGGSRKSSIGSLSPNQDPLNKNGSDKPNINSIKPLMATNLPNPISTVPLIRFSQQNSKGVIRPSLLQNPAVPMRKPMPIPTPGHPNYGPGPTNFGNQQRPGQGPFGPRPVPFIGPVQRPTFGPQPMPPNYGPPGGIRPPIPPTNFSGPRPFVGPNPAAPRPNINPGNRVTVNFSNLPPSTTFPLLCDQLAKCGQVMSVQLTTPGCAVATFGHPSHAERCFQTYNRMNVEGYIIEVKFV